LIFGCATDRANPVIRQFFKRGPGLYTVIRIPDFRIVHVAANRTHILVHGFLLAVDLRVQPLTFSLAIHQKMVIMTSFTYFAEKIRKTAQPAAFSVIPKFQEY
jgi:hypothetical protein